MSPFWKCNGLQSICGGIVHDLRMYGDVVTSVLVVVILQTSTVIVCVAFCQLILTLLSKVNHSSPLCNYKGVGSYLLVCEVILTQEE